MRQHSGPDHGDSEQDVTDHEENCRHPLVITAGEYWPRESSTADAYLAKTGARKAKFSVTSMRYVPAKAARKPTNPSGPIPPR